MFYKIGSLKRNIQTRPPYCCYWGKLQLQKIRKKVIKRQNPLTKLYVQALIFLISDLYKQQCTKHHFLFLIQFFLSMNRNTHYEQSRRRKRNSLLYRLLLQFIGSSQLLLIFFFEKNKRKGGIYIIFLIFYSTVASQATAQLRNAHTCTYNFKMKIEREEIKCR